MDTGSIRLISKNGIYRKSDLDVKIRKTHQSSFIADFTQAYQKQILFVFDCIKLSVFVFLLLFIYSRVDAATLEEQRLRSKSPWNFLNDFYVDTNAQGLNSVDNSSGGTYTSGLRYKINSQDFLWVYGRLGKRFTGEERFDLLDTLVRYERLLNEKLLGMSSRLRFDLTLPTNQINNERTSFVGALGSQIRFTTTLPYNVFLTWTNTVRWNFHTYRVSVYGSPNIQATGSTSLNFSYTLTPKTQLALGLGWSLAKSYENTVTSNYSIDVSGSYVLTDKWSAYAGWTTGGSPYTADGRNSNIQLFDERNTTYYIGVTHFM